MIWETPWSSPTNTNSAFDRSRWSAESSESVHPRQPPSCFLIYRRVKPRWSSLHENDTVDDLARESFFLPTHKFYLERTFTPKTSHSFPTRRYFLSDLLYKQCELIKRSTQAWYNVSQKLALHFLLLLIINCSFMFELAWTGEYVRSLGTAAFKIARFCFFIYTWKLWSLFFSVQSFFFPWQITLI